MADEPPNFLRRTGYDRSLAMEAVLTDAQRLAAREGRERFDFVKLYSCFPCVPKMARRVLGLPSDCSLSVAGGLTFFGAPLIDYMTHATVAMVKRLREDPTAVGLLYGQGEYVLKHHSLVLGAGPGRSGLKERYRRGDLELMLEASAPAVVETYEGPGFVESCTVLFGDRATSATAA